MFLPGAQLMQILGGKMSVELGSSDDLIGVNGNFEAIRQKIQLFLTQNGGQGIEITLNVGIKYDGKIVSSKKIGLN